MRISDWSSDVCASDLRCRHEVRDQHAYGLQRHVLGIRRHQLEAVPTDGRAVGELELTVDRAECRQTDVLALLHRVAGRVDDAQCVVTGWRRFKIAIRILAHGELGLARVAGAIDDLRHREYGRASGRERGWQVWK